MRDHGVLRDQVFHPQKGIGTHIRGSSIGGSNKGCASQPGRENSRFMPTGRAAFRCHPAADDTRFSRHRENTSTAVRQSAGEALAFSRHDL
jgi:hypothetical protein